MIQVFIAILLALHTGTACDLGEPVNWYDWAKEQGETAHLIFQVKPNDAPDAWVYQQANGDYLLFVFREKIDATLAAGRSDPHGECSVLIKAE